MNGRARISCGLLAGIAACLVAPSAASAADCGLPGSPGTGMSPVLDVQGDIDASRTGGYLQIPFEVDPGTTGIQVRYSYDQADGSCGGPNTLDMGVYEPKSNPSSPAWEQADRRGWSGSAVKNLAIAENGFTDEATYNASRKAFVDGFTTRAYQPGPIPAGTWAVELGIAYIDPADSDGIHYHVQVLQSSDPAWSDDPYSPSGPPRDLSDSDGIGLQPGWYAGDLHVHGEQEPGNATMTDTFAAAFGPGGAGLDFITLVDHNNDIAHNDMKTQADAVNALVIPGVEVTTYRGHWNNQGSDYFADFRGGPIYAESSPDDQIDDDELVKVQDGAKPKDEMAKAQAGGGWTQINHPAYFRDDPAACRGCAWSYSDDETDFAHVDAIEISNSIGALQASLPFTSDAIAYYEHALDSGAHIAAVASSDAHRAASDPISPVGAGVTAVYADPGLRRDAIIDGVKFGSTYVRPFGSTGPIVGLEAHSYGESAIIGGSISGEAVKLTANVDRSLADARPGTWDLTLLRNGDPIETTPITGETIVHEYEATESGRYGIEVTRTSGIDFVEAYTTPIWVTVNKPDEPKPDNHFKVKRAKKRSGVTILPVRVPGPGKLRLKGAAIKTRHAHPDGASTVKLRVKPVRRNAIQRLQRGGKVRVRTRIRYQPTGGTARVRKARVQIRR